MIFNTINSLSKSLSMLSINDFEIAVCLCFFSMIIIGSSHVVNLASLLFMSLRFLEQQCFMQRWEILLWFIQETIIWHQIDILELLKLIDCSWTFLYQSMEYVCLDYYVSLFVVVLPICHCKKISMFSLFLFLFLIQFSHWYFLSLRYTSLLSMWIRETS